MAYGPVRPTVEIDRKSKMAADIPRWPPIKFRFNILLLKSYGSSKQGFYYYTYALNASVSANYASFTSARSLYKELRAFSRVLAAVVVRSGLPPVWVRSLLLCACIDCVLLCYTSVLRNTVNIFVPYFHCVKIFRLPFCDDFSPLSVLIKCFLAKLIGIS